MTNKIDARVNHRDKRKAKRHEWSNSTTVTTELPVNAVEEKVEETKSILDQFKSLFTGER